MMGTKKEDNVNPIYPSVDPNSFKGQGYQPQQPTQPNQPTEGTTEDVNKSPTISQIMRDFK